MWQNYKEKNMKIYFHSTLYKICAIKNLKIMVEHMDLARRLFHTT
jgi:hypothetical protein